MSNACSSFAAFFVPPFPPDDVETCERLMNRRILISETVKNQHCDGGRGKSGNCPNSFDQDRTELSAKMTVLQSGFILVTFFSFFLIVGR